jgi:hypothetical protein
MIGRLSRAVRAHGVAGVANILQSRMRMGAHLLVPVEMLRHPQHISPWLRDRWSDNPPSQQGLPWLAWPCVDFLDSFLTSEHRVFEWGGGGSTLFFLKKGCRVTTVESSTEWVEELTRRVDDLGKGSRHLWDLRFVPAKGNDDPLIADYAAQVRTGGPWDAVLVDGWSRFKCLQAAMPYVKPGGMLALDNANQAQYRHVPTYMRGWEHRPFRGLGVARSWVTQTDVYIRPRE